MSLKTLKLIKYIILGALQGFTEPLPISSSGHLVIAKNLIKTDVLNDLNFEIIVNFGSLIAIVFLYRKTIFKLIKEFFLYIKTKDKKYKQSFKYCWLIVIGTIPAGLIGFILKDQIDKLSKYVKLIGVALLITAVALFIVRKKDGTKEEKDITYLDALKIGLFQAIALLPGISRSGSTIVGGLLSGLKKDVALTFSFMLYIPISLATLVLGVSDLAHAENLSELAFPYFISMIISAIVTYFSAKLFINIIKKKKLIYFVIYCLVVGTLVILFL